MAFAVIVDLSHVTPPLRQIDGHAVKNSVDVVHHLLEGLLGLAHLLDGGAVIHGSFSVLQFLAGSSHLFRVKLRRAQLF